MSPGGVENLRRSLIAALAFFDIFDYPLTLSELKRYLYRFDGSQDGNERPDTAAVIEALARSGAGVRHGYYFLPGRERIVDTRRRRYRLAARKYSKARRLARLFSFLPSISMIAVCNSLALMNADEDSDIDVFFVCRPGTVWATRLLVAGLLQIFGLRPTPRRQADAFCASFFVSERRLDLAALAEAEGDAYLRYWIASLVPLYDAGGVAERFLRANRWIADRLPRALPAGGPADRRTLRRRRTPDFLLPLLRALERPAKRLQTRLFPPEIRDKANLSSAVVVGDDILKFHLNDRRAYFEKLFREKLRSLDLETAKLPA